MAAAAAAFIFGKVRIKLKDVRKLIYAGPKLKAVLFWAAAVISLSIPTGSLSCHHYQPTKHEGRNVMLNDTSTGFMLH